jgi:NAD-dependent dihydropyrimidine dehydrogenase PreA subunit
VAQRPGVGGPFDYRVGVPVTIDESPCIDGCRLCVDVCPFDSPAIHPETDKAHVHVDERWYCGPCTARCPTGAVRINMRRARKVGSRRLGSVESGYTRC